MDGGPESERREVGVKERRSGMGWLDVMKQFFLQTVK